MRHQLSRKPVGHLGVTRQEIGRLVWITVDPKQKPLVLRCLPLAACDVRSVDDQLPLGCANRDFLPLLTGLAMVEIQLSVEPPALGLQHVQHIPPVERLVAKAG